MAAATENQAQASPQTLASDPFPPRSRISSLDLTAAVADPAELDLMDLGFSPLMSPAEETAEDTPVPFTVGDFVWAKIKHHPWWPGRVYDPSQASERARNAHRKDHCLLVTFCGDDSFAWVEPSQLKHFTAAEFPELSKQNAAKNFVVAVADFADAIGLRLESELACYCIPEEARAGLEPDVPVSANSPFGFTPEEFLERLHTAACDALSVDMLDAAMVRGWGLAFGKGDFSSGSFAYHPQLEIGELVDKIDMDALSLDLFGEELDHDELRSPEDRVVKDPDVAEKKPYRTRKGRSATKIVTGLDFSDIEVSDGEEKAASSKGKKSKKDNVAEAVGVPGSGRRGRKAPKYVSDDEEKAASKGKKSKQANAAEAVDVSGSGRRGRRAASKNVSEDEEKAAPKSMESKQETAAEAVDGSVSRRRGKKKINSVSDGEVKVESNSKTSKKEDTAEAVDGSGSGRPERKASKRENAVESVEALDGSGSGRPERKASKRENAVESVEALDGSGSGRPERKASKKDNAPEAVVDFSSGRPERKKSKPVIGGEEKATPKSKKGKRVNAADLADDSAAGRRERKKSKYLSPPYTVAVGTDQIPDSPTSTESETLKNATGSLRPKSPRISKSVSSVFQEDEDADVDDNEEDSKSPVYKIDSTSAADILSLFLAAAINPLNLKRHGSSRTVRDFFAVYRSAMYCSDSEFEDYKKYLDAGINQDVPKDGKMDGKKGKKGGAKEETTPHAGLTVTDNSEQKKADNSEQKKAGLKRKTRKDSNNAEPLVDLNRETADSPEEGKSSQKKKKVKDQEPMSSGEASKTKQKITKGNKGSTPEAPSKLLQKNETDEDYSPSPVETQSVVTNGLEAGKPGPKRKKEAAATNEGPAALLLTFAPGITLPSKENLVATFRKYGDLIESETDSVQKSGCARVVFVKSIDAEKAFNSRNKTKEFGSAVPSYRLCPLSGNATSPPRQTAIKTPLPSIKKGLQRMISNLTGSSTPERDAGSSDGLLPEVREDLVDEMKGLLAKVDKILKGPAAPS